MGTDEQRALEDDDLDGESLGRETAVLEPLSDEERLLVLFSYLRPLALVALLT